MSVGRKSTTVIRHLPVPLWPVPDAGGEPACLRATHASLSASASPNASQSASRMEIHRPFFALGPHQPHSPNIVPPLN